MITLISPDPSRLPARTVEVVPSSHDPNPNLPTNIFDAISALQSMVGGLDIPNNGGTCGPLRAFRGGKELSLEAPFPPEAHVYIMCPNLFYALHNHSVCWFLSRLTRDVWRSEVVPYLPLGAILSLTVTCERLLKWSRSEIRTCAVSRRQRAFGDSDVLRLRTFTGLRSLDLSTTTVSHLALDVALHVLPLLEILDLSFCPQVRTLQSITALHPTLHTLILNGCPQLLRSNTFACRRNFPSLRSITIAVGSSLAPQGMRAYPHLVIVHVVNYTVKTIAGTTIPLAGVPLGATVRDIKQTIYRTTKLEMSWMTLSFGTGVLPMEAESDDTMVVAEVMNVTTDGPVIYMAYQVRSGNKYGDWKR